MTNNPHGGDEEWWCEFGLPARLRAARERTGLGKEQFADLIGIHPDTIRSYENPNSTSRRKDLVIKEWAAGSGSSLVWIKTGVPPVNGGGGGILLTMRSHNEFGEQDDAPTDYKALNRRLELVAS